MRITLIKRTTYIVIFKGDQLASHFNHRAINNNNNNNNNNNGSNSNKKWFTAVHFSINLLSSVNIFPSPLKNIICSLLTAVLRWILIIIDKVFS